MLESVLCQLSTRFKLKLMYRTMVGIKSCALTEYTAFIRGCYETVHCSAVELKLVIEKSVCSYIKVDLDRRKLQEDIEAESLQVSNGFVAADNDVSFRLKYSMKNLDVRLIAKRQNQHLNIC